MQFSKHIALIILVVFLFETPAKADICDKKAPIVSFLSEVWFVTSETLKGAARDIRDAYNEERLMRDVAANRYEQLINQGVSIAEAFKILDEEGLGPYIMSSAGRVPPMTGMALRKILERNGFKLLRTSGSHQILSNGAKNVVVPFHGSKDLGKGLINSIINEAGLRPLFN